MIHPRSSTLRQCTRWSQIREQSCYTWNNKYPEYIRKNGPKGELLRQQKPTVEVEEQEKPSWKDQPLYGMYHWQIKEVAGRNKSVCAKSFRMENQSVGFIFALTFQTSLSSSVSVQHADAVGQLSDPCCVETCVRWHRTCCVDAWWVRSSDPAELQQQRR